MITLFAELTLCRENSLVRRFRSQKAAALLAFLAFYRGRAFSREFLCEMLWPEQDPEVTRNRLRVTLASLRRQLETPGVPFGTVLETIGNSEIRLRAEAITTDVACFEAAVKENDSQRALTLYRGPLLPSFYEDWILEEQERLAGLYEQFRNQPGGSVAPGSRSSEVVTEARTAVETKPGARLPLYLTRFIGREAELATLRGLFAAPDVRLITLTGPGGNGKTRLAVEAAKTDPTLRAFVSLADVWDVKRLGNILRQALHIAPALGQDPFDQIAAVLRGQPARVIVDNCEHLALPIAPSIMELLHRIPELSLVVTSRRRLDLPGERELFVAPLGLPEQAAPEGMVCTASVRLFVDRAQSLRPDFQVTVGNAPDIAAICHLLDGVPLALELAASRVGMLPPSQMRAHLEESRLALSALPRAADKEDRHRSLKAVLEWSFALLPPDLRRFLLTLSLFRGGWDLEAAEAVTGEAQALDFLSRLRGHSLVTPDGTRFRLLETLRLWAEERLSVPEREMAAERHRAYFLALGERGVCHFGGSEETEWLDRLAAEEANLHVAFANSLHTAQAETALRFALILYALERARGSLTEAREVLDRALSAPGETDPHLRARALVSLGSLVQLMQGPEAARSPLEAALSFARTAEDPALTARTLRSLADNALLQEEYDTALSLYQEALPLQQAHGDERGAAQTLNSLALLHLRHTRDVATARRLTEESAAYFRKAGDRRMLSYSLYNLGELAFEQGDAEAAEAQIRESLALSEETQDEWQRLYCLLLLARVEALRGRVRQRRVLVEEALPLALRLGDRLCLADGLEQRAEIAVLESDFRRAVVLLAAGEAVRKLSGSAPHEPSKQEGFDTALAAARSGLPQRSFRACWTKGETFTPQQAVTFALGS
jgi:predicted ATPase/DNA-binding winged helix-turn-helix (wHTH) protein